MSGHNHITGMTSSLSASFPPGGVSIGGAHERICLEVGGQPPPASITSSSSTGAFKLRPRSTSLHIAGLSNSTDDMSQMKPRWLQAHSISPDGPMFPSSKVSASAKEAGDNDPPTAAAIQQHPSRIFASLFASGNHCSSPIKKQKIADQHLRRQTSSPDSSNSCASESNLDSPPLAAAASAALAQVAITTAGVAFPSSPAIDRASSNNTSGVGTFTINDDGNATSNNGADTSPFTPNGRLMMQKLCIQSHSTSLASASPTPEKPGGSSILLTHQNFPTMPTFSFSPSKKHFGKEDSTSSQSTTKADSSVRETIAFSAGSTPQGSPKRGGCSQRGSTSACASTSSSPFLSLRGQMTPIGQQRGSVFKSLPPRLYPMGRDDTESTIGTCANETTSGTCSSLNSASPSPRVVPLTVLSRNNSSGSPAMSPNIPNTLFGPIFFDYPPVEPSPALVLRHGSKDDGNQEPEDIEMTPSNHYLPSPRFSDIEIPNISKTVQSPLSRASRESHQLLPRIKLTPRGMFASSITARDDACCRDVNATSRRRSCAAHSTTTSSCADDHRASSSLVYSPEQDKVASEMDCLLHGFEQQQQRSDSNMGLECTTHQENPDSSFDTLNRVESEETEMVALTQGHHYKVSADHRLRPNTLAAVKDQDETSDGNCDVKPMSSITLNMESSCHRDVSSSILATSPSFLPRPVPMDQRKSRSLFDTARNSYDRILLADAIAEAARSNEPLTDEDSDIDGNSDFLLCLPQGCHVNGNGSNSKSVSMCHNEKQSASSKPSTLVRADSISFYHRSSNTFPKRSSGDQGVPSLSAQSTLTIFEGCTAMPQNTTSKRLTEGMMMKQGASDATFATYCSLSDCDTSEIITSPKYYKMKPLGGSKERHSVCSLLSMSSLCGLDIVHETSQCGGQDVTNKITPSLLSSEYHDLSANSFRPLHLTRSEFSMNSLGLSLDSMDAGVDSISTRELFTPPTAMGTQNCKRMLSPPPLRHRPNSFYQNWN